MAATTEALSVTAALCRVMADLPGIGKGNKAAPQQGGYAYRGIEDITSALQPLLAKHGVVFVPKVTDHAIKDITVQNKPWTDTTMLVTYTVYGPDGSSIEVGPIVAYGRDNSDKGANKCMTQAYKYALIQTLCIGDKADDNDGITHEADAAVEVDPLWVEHMDQLGELVKTTTPPEEKDRLAAHLRAMFGTPHEMTLSQVVEAINVAAGWPQTGPDEEAA